MSGSELLSTYDALHEQIAELEAYGAEIVARMDEIGHAKHIGASDTARLLAERYRLDAAEAHRRVNFATNLHKYPAIAAALPRPGTPTPDDGVVLHMGQARAIMSALEQIPARANVAAEDLAEAEQSMVHAARQMSPSNLQAMGVQVRNILDTDGPEPRENTARQRETLHITKEEGGIRFNGRLAAENAELLETLVESGAKPRKTVDGDPDPRPRGKRQADALTDALNIAAGTGDLPACGGIKPHITVIIDLDDLITAGKNATGDLVFGDGLSAGAVRRLACDAGIIPVILGSDSQPLDVGREYRCATTGLRNALNQRDRGCVVCGAPPIYCDAHHLTSWLDGGTTTISNLVLLCRVHHTALHDGHWTIQIINNQVHVTRPNWTDPPPRHHRQPPPLSPPDPPPTAAPDADTRQTTGPAHAPAPDTDTCTTTGPAHPAAPDADTRPNTDRVRPAPPDTNTHPTTGPAHSPASDTDPSSRPIPTSAAAPTSSDTDPWPPLITTNPPLTPTHPWPFTTDTTWPTPEEAAALNPWPDTT